MSDPWLIFLDVDGTLVDDGRPPTPLTVRAIRDARRNGHVVYLCTGRSRSGLPADVTAIGFDGAVTASGGFIEADGELVSARVMAEDDIRYLLRFFAAQELEYAFQGLDRSYPSRGLRDRMLAALGGAPGAGAVSTGAPDAGTPGAGTPGAVPDPAAHARGLAERSAHRAGATPTEVAKAMFLGADEGAYRRVCAGIGPRFHVVTGTVGALGEQCGEITVRGTDKGTALHHVARLVGIPMARTLAIGDSANDVDMLRAAGIGVAMGGASDAALDAADETTATVAADGVWHALHRHGLLDAE